EHDGRQIAVFSGEIKERVEIGEGVDHRVKPGQAHIAHHEQLQELLDEIAVDDRDRFGGHGSSLTRKKHEIRNKFKIQSTDDQRIWSFVLRACLVFGASNFGFPLYSITLATARPKASTPARIRSGVCTPKLRRIMFCGE